MENNNKTPKVLYRSNTNRIIFGVCGGLGEYLNIDPIIFRIVFLLLVFGAGSGVLIYLIMAILIPRNPSIAPAENTPEAIKVKERIHELAAELRTLKKSAGGRRRGDVRLLLGFILLVIGFGFLIQNLNIIPGFHFDFFFNFWPVLIIIVGLLILSREMR